tara:strand:- start:11251 stop:12396 length:1146 start_codon:yes stop_codon:yes gene_type:complete
MTENFLKIKTEVVRPIHELTGIRFFAALHVVFFHNFYLSKQTYENAPDWVLHFISFGDSAVSFFFILSGFILTYAYTNDSLKLKTSAREYFWGRFARLYPLYLLGLLIDLPRGLSYFFNTYDFKTAVLKTGISASAYVTMLQSWYPRVTTTWNSPAWSLSDEMFFYLIFPLALPLIFRLHRTVVAMLFLYLFPIALYFLVVPIFVDDLSSGTFSVFWRSFPLVRVSDFFIGLLLGKIFITENKIKYFVRRHHRWFGGFFWIILLLSLVLISLDINFPKEVFSSTFLVPCFSTMIILLATIKVPLTGFLRSKPLVILGNASFALYITHQPILYYIDYILRALGIDLSLLYFVFYLIIALTFSLICYFFFEKPLQKRLRNLYR